MTSVHFFDRIICSIQIVAVTNEACFRHSSYTKLIVRFNRNIKIGYIYLICKCYNMTINKWVSFYNEKKKRFLKLLQMSHFIYDTYIVKKIIHASFVFEKADFYIMASDS